MNAVITGVTSGIGRALTDEYIRRGWKVVGVARREERLEELKKLYGEAFDYIVWDLSRTEKTEELAERIDKKAGRVDLLINNAGMGSYGRFVEGDTEEDRRMIRVNIEAVTELTRVYLKRMVAVNKGGIINVASTAGFQRGGPLMAAYYGSKSYVLSMDEGIRGELEENPGNRVKVMTLCPGPTVSEFIGMEKGGSKGQLHLTTPSKVARDCYLGYEKGREIVIPGWINRISVLISTFIPRKIQRKLIYRIQKKKRP